MVGIGDLPRDQLTRDSSSGYGLLVDRIGTGLGAVDLVLDKLSRLDLDYWMKTMYLT